MTNQYHRLYRSQTNKVIAGVCGGLAEYLNMDATVVRLAWILLTLLGGSGIILYILAFFIVPEGEVTTNNGPPSVKSNFSSGRMFGILFVVVGAILLLDNLEIFSFCRLWDMSWEFVFPALLILAGIYLMAKRSKVSTSSSEQAPPAEPDRPSEHESLSPEGSTQRSVNPKVFRRSRIDKKIFGICGGAGEFFGIDPTIVRIAYAIFTVLSGGAGVILYLLMYLIVPEGQPQPNKQQ